MIQQSSGINVLKRDNILLMNINDLLNKIFVQVGI